MRVQLALSLLLVTMSLVGCATTGGTLGRPQELTVEQIKKLTRGGQQILEWSKYTLKEDELANRCIKGQKPEVRYAGYQACYANPLRVGAQQIQGQPEMLKKGLESYLAKVQNLLQRSAHDNVPEAQVLSGYVQAKDEWLVGMHRYVNDRDSIFRGFTVSSVTDVDVQPMKAPKVTQFIANSDINGFLGRYQVFQVNNMRRALAQKLGGLPPGLTDKLELREGDRRALSATYAAYVHSLYSMEDLDKLNQFYTARPERVKQDQQAMLSVNAAASELFKAKATRTAGKFFKVLGQRMSENPDASSIITDVQKALEEGK